MNQNEDVLFQLYERCQKAYHDKYGFYYYYISGCCNYKTDESRRIRKYALAQRLEELGNAKFNGWNNGWNITNDKYLAPMMIEYDSLEELDLKLSILGY